MLNGSMIRMGVAKFAAIVFAICTNSVALKTFMERLNANHGPQNTPVTNIKRIVVINCIQLNIIQYALSKEIDD